MRKLRLVPDVTTFDFMRHRVLFLAISAALVLLSIGLVVVRGINFGVDFRGGILIEARTNGPADLANLRGRLNALGLGEVGLQQFGAPTDVLINFGEQPGGEKGQLGTIDKVKATLGDTVSEYRRIEIVGPKVGAELVRGGIIATTLAMAAIAGYVWFRFEWQFGVSALISLVHDVVTTLGLFSLFQLEFNLPTLAAVLTIAGYSINDTVVIFDRVREDLSQIQEDAAHRPAKSCSERHLVSNGFDWDDRSVGLDRACYLRRGGHPRLLDRHDLGSVGGHLFILRRGGAALDLSRLETGLATRGFRAGRRGDCTPDSEALNGPAAG